MKAHTDISVHIINQAKNGDSNACGIIYHHFSKAMFSLCMRMASNREQAEDILHDAFIKIFNNLGQLKQPEAIAGWIKRIVLNECIKQTSSKIQIVDTAINEETLADESSNENWFNGISLQRIHEAIKELPDGCRQIFVLFAMEGLTHRQIAEALGVSEGTSKSQYFRAKVMLKENLLTYLKVAHG